MKKKYIRFLALLLFIFVLVQFISPKKNLGDATGPGFIFQSVVTPDNTQQLLKNACFNCHSNHTDYPWYGYVAPVSWWLNGHINGAKDHLNFSEWDKYSRKDQIARLNKICEDIKEGDMPLASYRLIHKEARLTSAEKQEICSWADTAGMKILENKNSN